MPSDREIVGAMEALPEEGGTAIERHLRSSELKEVVVAYALTPERDRPALAEFTRTLNDEFDSSLTAQQVKYYLERRVVPALYVPPSFVRKGLFESGEDLNTALSKVKIANRMRELFERAMLDPDVKPQDVAALSRAAIDALGKAEESLERWESVPKRRSESASVRVNVDMDKIKETLGDMGEIPLSKGKDFTSTAKPEGG